jgi:hypothetical protein
MTFLLVMSGKLVGKKAEKGARVPGKRTGKKKFCPHLLAGRESTELS